LKKVLIAVSGTGGHVYPGIAIAEELRARHPELEIRFAAAAGKPGASWIRSAGFEVRSVRLRGLARRPSLTWLGFPLFLLLGCVGALSLLLSESPRLVVGTGGYVSGPFIALAALLRIPTVILEQNSLPGMATRLGSLFAQEVHVADATAIRALPRRGRAHPSGNPVRRQVEEGDAAAFRSAHRLDATEPTVLVIGGSQGALALTEASLAAAKILGPEAGLQMVVQTGERGLGRARELAREAPAWVRVVPFLERIGDAYAAATLVVARAGAMTLAELAAAGVPAVLVPYPFAAADHQTVNARRYADSGAARVVPQAELVPERLAALLAKLVRNETELSRMGEAARRSAGARARDEITRALERRLGLG
jgi:UDP-N-acetylglucosamine--N-acetylmuramyl-(pentapeptide) pyrophosphoryl-undecaprenol N-acetylglucosamine transferase